MNFTFMTLKALLIDYNQFRKSKLQIEIMSVLKCTYTEAFDLGKTHCNMISTWAILFALGAHNKSYSAFFRECLDKKLCNIKGFFKVDKIDVNGVPGLFTQLGLKIKVTKTCSIPEEIGKHQAFQIAINDKSHFMAAASADDGNIFLFDTNNRTYGAELIEALSEKNDKIVWMKRFEVI